MKPNRMQARSWLEQALMTPFDAVIQEAKITPRQREIVRLRFVEGLLNYQISQRLNISPETVRDELAVAYDRITVVLRGM